MICPRCGNEWDASKGACTRCGFVVRTSRQPGSFPNQTNTSLMSNQSSGGLANPARQQSHGMTSVKQQSGGLAFPSQPGFPITGRPTPPPAPGSNFGFPSTPSQLDQTFPKPGFEKTSLKAVPQSPQQTAINRSDSQPYSSGSQGLQTQNSSSSIYTTNRSMAYPVEDMRRSQAPVQPQTPVRQYPLESPNRNVPNQQMQRPTSSFIKHLMALLRLYNPMPLTRLHVHFCQACFCVVVVTDSRNCRSDKTGCQEFLRRFGLAEMLTGLDRG